MSSGDQFKIEQNCNSLLHYFCGSLTKKHTHTHTWGNQSTSHAASFTKQLVLLKVFTEQYNAPDFTGEVGDKAKH